MRHPHAHRMRNLTGVPGPLCAPGSDEWLRTMSASKVAAVVGLSPWTSRFALWHEMAGTIGRDSTDAMSRGHYLEPAVAAWFADRHPTWTVVTTGTWTHHEHPWATATPDRLVLVPRSGARLLEVKTASHADEWGADGSDEIPAGYRCQVVWSMHVTGARIGHVAALLPFLDLREYVIEYDADEARFLEQECASFMHDLAHGVAPELDGSDSTYQAVRQLHPDIDDVEVELPLDVAADLAAWKHEADHATAGFARAKSAVLAAMGTARKASCNGWPIATRAAKNGGTPYLSLARTLPTEAEILTSRKESA